MGGAGLGGAGAPEEDSGRPAFVVPDSAPGDVNPKVMEKFQGYVQSNTATLNEEWYAALTQPSWNPPAWVFPAMWIPIKLAQTVGGAVAWRALAHKVFAAPIVFPMVAKGKARVRVITSASFSKADCDAGLAAFKKVKAALA